MKRKVILTLLVTNQMLFGCQLFFPSSDIDNEPNIICLTENFYIDDFDLLKKDNKTEVYEVILHSIDSINENDKNEFIFSKEGKYFILKNGKVSNISKFNDFKLLCIDEYLKMKETN